jgi:hypothetical protein
VQTKKAATAHTPERAAAKTVEQHKSEKPHHASNS